MLHISSCYRFLDQSKELENEERSFHPSSHYRMVVLHATLIWHLWLIVSRKAQWKQGRTRKKLTRCHGECSISVNNPSDWLLVFANLILLLPTTTIMTLCYGAVAGSSLSTCSASIFPTEALLKLPVGVSACLTSGRAKAPVSVAPVAGQSRRYQLIPCQQWRLCYQHKRTESVVTLKWVSHL